MSKALFLNTLKQGYKLVLIFSGILVLYQLTIIGIADPVDMEATKEIFMAFESLMSAFGINAAAMTELLSYTASTFFSTLVMIFCMVFYIIVTAQLVFKKIDNSSLSYTLSMPISRTQFIVTQMVYLSLALVFQFAMIFASGAIFMSIKTDIDILAYLNLVVLCMLLNIMLALLVLLLSVLCSTTKKLQYLPSAFPIMLLFITIISGVGGESFDWFGAISPFSWIDSVGVVQRAVSTLWIYIVLVALISITTIANIVVFNKKRLPI